MARLMQTFCVVVFLAISCTNTNQAEPVCAAGNMPIKEITVFKDGHAFVLHEGLMPTDASGNVVLDHLPSPVIGTFWPYSADKKAKLTAVTFGLKTITVKRTALALVEIIEANIGKQVQVAELGEKSYSAKIIGIPVRDTEELAQTSPPNSGKKLPQKGNVVLFGTESGVKVVSITNIRDITIEGKPTNKIEQTEFRNMLTMKMDWHGETPQKTAQVGMVYLQRGVRWIPSYKITLDGKGRAVVKLQATLLNELADMDDVVCNLVVGVPTFAFKGTIDPIAIQTVAARLSPYFKTNSRTAAGLSNAIMTQTPCMTNARANPSAARPMDLGPEVGDSEQTEDLFVFTAKHVTLKKGERMVFPVAEYTLPYKDIYTLDIPFSPPPEVYRSLGSQRKTEIARLLAQPKVMHKIRLSNKSDYPLTTAPVLILRGERLLAQGMMTYTAIGGKTDLEITAAVDIQVKKQDREIQRVPNAEMWKNSHFTRVDLAGSISLTNFRKESVELEIVRHVLVPRPI